MLEGTLGRSSKIYRRNRGFAVEPIDVHGSDGLVVRFDNGKRIQITQKLADVLSEVDGESSCEEIAVRLAQRWRMPVAASDVEGIAERFLRPYQLALPVGEALAAPPGQTRSRTRRWRDKLLLQEFFFSFPLIPSERVAAATRYTAPFFSPWAVAAFLTATAVAGWYAAREVVALRAAGTLRLTDPMDYLMVLLLVLGSVLFHEIGHATAVKRFGAVPDHIGFGLYFIYPAFYANVNESWRFSRRQRVVVDLAGIYFQAILAPLLVLGYRFTREISFLYAVLFSLSLAIYSLVPFFKFDGYWCLADGLGVPNLRKRSFQYLSHHLRRLRNKDAELPAYLRVSPSVGAMLLLYALGSLVFFGFVLSVLVRHAPAMYQAYPDEAVRTVSLLARNFSAGLFSAASVVLIQFLLRTFALLGVSLLLLSLGISLHGTAKRLVERRT